MHKVQTSTICTEHLHYESSNKFNHLKGHSKKKTSDQIQNRGLGANTLKQYKKISHWIPKNKKQRTPAQFSDSLEPRG